ncbi:glycoside hydrolase family 99-like domain-containing protein [Acetobacter fallax]|uniref:Glycosyltransferase n=2 Tax=Acetobacter fallax TaxID=1737473 RepID=A0ABX0K8I2_9PROT|nr:glycoside hydrolase family 99-like domain-containing protein [Acetobacter fallax]NHO32674.1 glycosyltransferase [Acetobacter fallax]NHO36266.1 glycosyltransferase [Acetobacter fallax]
MSETHKTTASTSSSPEECDITSLRIIGHSGLFDTEFYTITYPDLADLGTAALAHYIEHGWREGRRPNQYFDPHWYVAENPEVTGDPLLHYITTGEAEGRRPIAWFDPVWYRETYPVPEGMLLLRHYLLNRHRTDVSPMPEFDPAFYLRIYPDVAQAGVDPLEHYMVQGFREARRPFADFDPLFYRARYLATDPDTNPLVHYLENRHRPGVHSSARLDETNVFSEQRRNTRPGPFFETRQPLPASAVRRARVLAYYLPQFHRIPQNDEWWGTGFTEWTNVTRGMPRFLGHYQPRIPRDLGHYTLDNPDILREQARMAREAGIEGFVFYFYWFNGTRLLDSPLEMLLASPDIDLPFCLMWANENWSRRWDGSEDDVLIAQDFRPEDEAALIACFVRHFSDPRYIHIDGRPLLMVYRPGVIPHCATTIARWRRLFLDACGADPIFVMSQSFGDNEPEKFGIDGAIEFPPHKVVGGLSCINPQMALFDMEFTGQIYDYSQVVDNALDMPTPDFPLIRTAAPSWDNDARRQGAGLVMHGSTPALYERWLSGLIDEARKAPFFGQPLVCINAWNEWAEGAYLEPDQHFGAAFLNATARAVTGFCADTAPRRLMLVGHDTFPAGAQMLLLNIGRALRRNHGLDILFVLLDGGALTERYREIGSVEFLSPNDPAAFSRLESFAKEGYVNAIVNTAGASGLTDTLSAAGIRFIQLVHELPAIIANRRLAEPLSRSVAAARMTVFPATTVAQRVTALLPAPPHATEILPQGLYTPIRFIPKRRQAIRKSLGISPKDRLILGSGYGDMRKGFDLFLQLWCQTESVDETVQGRTHLIWLGNPDPALRDWLGAEIGQALESGRLHLPGHVDTVQDYLSAADVFVLTSREDPYPSVVMEALAAGLPCVAFQGSGGAPDLLARITETLGTDDMAATVPLADTTRMARRAVALATRGLNDGLRERASLARQIAGFFPFDHYAERLLDLAAPERRRISVVVLSYNYARYLAARLSSIFTQTYPVLEIIVLDDASADDSVAVAEAVATEWDRKIRIIPSRRGSGSVFAQWRRAVNEARGDWIWVAEADDIADPAFLTSLSVALDAAPNAVMAFCDSRAIDTDGAPLYDSYKPYYATSGVTALQHDGIHDGPAFVANCLGERNLIMNASAVLFRRDALQAALARCADLESFRIAGDWRLYIELLNQPGVQVAYVERPLNAHRRHQASATGKLAPDAHLAEISRVHQVVNDKMRPDKTIRKRQKAYLEELARQFAPPVSTSAAPEDEDVPVRVRSVL